MSHDPLREALMAPVHVVQHEVSRAIHRARPDAYVLESEEASFDVRRAARDGLVEIRDRLGTHTRFLTFWEDFRKPIGRIRCSGWRTVLWSGQSLELVEASWRERGCQRTVRWLIAEKRTTAEAFFRFVVEHNEKLRAEIWTFDDGYWFKSEELHEAVAKASFDGLILAGGLVDEIRDDFRRFIEARETYGAHDIAWKRGALFHGPPGNGKTHCIRALLKELELPVLYVKSFNAMYQTPEKLIHRAFEHARRLAPCVFVLEDLDALITAETKSFFLNELDGFHQNEGLITIASTNHPERLDPAIVERPSRFDRKYEFGLPEPAERRRYAETWNPRLDETQRLSDSALDQFAATTEGFSYAYLKEAFVSTLMVWIGDGGSFAELLSAQVASLSKQISPPPDVGTHAGPMG